MEEGADDVVVDGDGDDDVAEKLQKKEDENAEEPGGNPAVVIQMEDKQHGGPGFQQVENVEDTAEKCGEPGQAVVVRETSDKGGGPADAVSQIGVGDPGVVGPDESEA